MKKLLFVLLGLSGFALPTFAADEKLGVGAIVGEPVALSGEYILSSRRSVDAGFGYSWSHSVLFYGDYLFHFPGAFSSDYEFVDQLVPYAGIGPELEIYSSGHRKHINDHRARAVVSARVPLGLGWSIPDSPIKLFTEIVPVLNLIPGLEIDIHAGIGARFYF